MKKYVFDEKKYKVKEKKEDGCIYIVASPKKRNCKLCNKVIEVAESDFIGWLDDNHYYRTGYFCREHKQLICKVLKKVDRI